MHDASSWTADEIPTPLPFEAAYRWRIGAPLWLAIRLYVGASWLLASWEKLTDPSGGWIGAHHGEALRGFATAALAKSTGPHPDVAGWYATLLSRLVIPHATAFAWLVTAGEFAVGVALIVGLFTGVAAFFGGFMNLAFMLAGTVSVNPILFVLATGLVLAWRVAGHWGLDRWALPRLGAPGWPGPRAWRRAALVAEFSQGK